MADMNNFAQSTNGSFGRTLWWVIAIVAILGIIVIVSIFYSQPKTSDISGIQQTALKYPTQNMRTETENTNENYEFDDGLGQADSIKEYELDELGEGIASVEIFNRDINKDGAPDRITRVRQETGTAHWYYEYKIELNMNNNFVGIKPEKFRTTEGAECALEKWKFVFEPRFKLIKISRNWEDSWTTPTMALRSEYELFGNELRQISFEKLQKICNVSDLF